MLIEKLKTYFQVEKSQLLFSLGESDEIECKQTIRIDGNGSPRNFDDSIRAIAALANNKGGILLYGIAETTNANGDKVWIAKGLSDQKFMTLDPGNLSMLLSESLMPFVKIESFHFKVDEKFFAGFFVESAENKPVLSIKNTQSTKEGCVYFRYPGQSKPIKFSELEEIISSREARQLENLSKIFSTIVALSDDENLSDINQYLGDLPIKRAQEHKTQQTIIVNDGEQVSKDAVHVVAKGVAVSDVDIIENFIFQRQVDQPMSYVSHYCQIARGYLPIYFYLNAANYKTPETRVNAINNLKIRKTGNVAKVVNRVRESGGLFNNNSSPAKEYGDKLAAGAPLDFFDLELDVLKAMRALSKIDKGSVNRKTAFKSLQSGWQYYKSNPDKRLFDALCYATCHIDYLFFE